MSYHIYTTPGIILKRRAFGESDTVLHILTRDLGLIMVSAKATRTLQSKLRGSLQEYSLSTISLVKGKNGWKVINAVLIRNYFFDSEENKKIFFAKIGSFLLKIITGEMAHKEVYEIVSSGFDSVLEENVDSSNTESLLVLRVMKELGYVVSDNTTRVYFEDQSDWSGGVLERVSKDKLKIIEIINKAIKESHL